ncbi:MAG: hypothetical protein JRG89_14925 [Deltaproteobacteria bacterium]|nr:hypothetical protein [Deltaproteobacteria bacterium]
MRTPTPMGTIPKPTVRAALANGFQVFSDDAIPLLVIGFIVVAAGAACRSLILLSEFGAPLSLASYVFVAGPLELGLAFVCLRAVRSGQAKLEHLLAIFGRYWPVVIANTLLALILPGAFAFLVVPGIALFCATRFVPFLLLEDELGGAAAIIESIRLSRDCFWQLVAICAVGMVAVLLGGFSILGLVPAIVWWNLSIASLYHSLVRPPQGWEIEDEEDLDMLRSSQEEETEEIES